ncbi:MAG: hypothetical protein KC464_03495, partial [Myxococcales bacterium]|nr:hypothetical protein [Myxococcales bacterium]
SGAAVATAKDPPAGAAASRSTWQIVEADGTKHGPDETFQLEVVDPAPVAVGGKATFQLKVTPGKSYHVNTCDPGESDCSPYPVKLELTPPAEVQVAKAKLGLGDVAEIDKQHMVLAFDAVPGAAGSHTIAGKFKFAVCQEEACHPRKVEMQFVVAAK